MAKSDNYWRDRELDHIKNNKKTDAQIAKAISSNQKMVMKDIEQQIEAFYGRAATTEGITMAEARKRVSKLDIDDYAAKAKRYVKGAHSSDEFIKSQSFTDLANEEMRLYNLTMKTNRLELLKANIALDVAAMTSDMEHYTVDYLTKNAREEYKRQAGILGMTVNGNEKSIGKIVNSSFLNATWSDRLWANQQALKGELNKLLNRGIVQGKNPRELARDLRKTFGASIADSERLMRTEMARVQTEVLLDSMNQLELTHYEWVAEPDACKLCAALDGKIFDLKDMEYGLTAVPRHPHCRCSLAAAMDREAFEKDLDKRGLFAEGDEMTKNANDVSKESVEKVSDKLMNHEEIKSRAERETALLNEYNKLYEEVKRGQKEVSNMPTETDKQWAALQKKNDETNAKVGKLNKVRGDYHDAKERHVYDNAKTVKQELSKFRAMGIGDIDMKGHLNMRSKASKTVMEAYDYYPTEWVKKSVEHSNLTGKSVKRGYYSHGEGVIALSGGGSSSFRTALHELGHRQEYVNPGILEAEKAFYELRTKGEDLKRLRDVTGIGYRADEVTRVDNFLDAYMGKEYPNQRAYELLTMGLDTLYTHPQELAKDPEMFKWVVETILTK